LAAHAFIHSMAGRWNISVLLRALLATLVMASLGGQAFAHAGHMAAAQHDVSVHDGAMAYGHHGGHGEATDRAPDRPDKPCVWCDRAGGCLGGLLSAGMMLLEPAFRLEPLSALVAVAPTGRDDDFTERPPRLI
jgi:hypothetical protein